MENSAFVIEGSRLVKCTDPDLEEIIVPEGITEIGDRAFQNGWMTAVRLPEGLTTIGDEAFRRCYVLEKVHFPKGLRSIGKKAFLDCSLREICLPEGMESIGTDAFRGVQLEKATFSPGLRSIGVGAFRECSIQEAELPEGLVSLEKRAFENCAQLRRVRLPARRRWGATPSGGASASPVGSWTLGTATSRWRGCVSSPPMGRRNSAPCRSQKESKRMAFSSPRKGSFWNTPAKNQW